jgi:hypothetical protein
MCFTKVGNVSVLLLALTACSGEPSASEIKRAVQDSFAQDASLLNNQNLLGVLANVAGLQNIQLDSVDKVGCQPDGDYAHRCEVVIEYTMATDKDSLAAMMGVGGSKRVVARYRFLKTSKGWIIDQGAN